MNDQLTALTTLFTEFYYWIVIVFMFFIHIGFCMYEVGASRRKNLLHTLMKNTMLIPVVTLGTFLWGWWIYFGLSNVPFNAGGFIPAPWSLPWSELMGAHMGGVSTQPDLLVDSDVQFWARLNGVFWGAFLLFSWTAASIVSGACIERVRSGAFLIVAVLLGSVTWFIDAAWGWNPAGWMVQLMGYHDAYASGVIHAIAGGTALGVIIVLGPRIGRFGPNGEVRDIKPHNPWLITIGLFAIFAGFWGFYVACNVPILNVGTEEAPFFSTTNIYLLPTTTSAIVFNFLLSFSGGLMAGYMVSKGDPFWTYSCGLAGIITASAGNDWYHPLQAFVVGAFGAWCAYTLHNWVTRRFKIDDPVGAVAVHGYCGTIGTIIPGFLLWGYPAVAPSATTLTPWFDTTAEGWAAINPLGQIIGAFIMFFVLGFVPGWVTAKILKAIGMLRVPREVELAGLDTHFLGDAYPYFPPAETEFEPIERQYVRQ